ncbi:hypothetical protein ACVCNR_14810 [Aquamicrobium terrae]
MTGRLSDLGQGWTELADQIADWSVDLLRRARDELAGGIDRDAMRDVEGARDWRDLQRTGDRYAD